MNLKAAQTWYANAVEEFRHQCATQSRNIPRYQLEVFVRAVVAVLLGKDGRSQFPDTLYLDQDRLRTLKAEIDDLICFDVCMDLFTIVARQSGYDGPMSLGTEQQVRASISAIMGEALGHGPQQWMMNSEALSLEILRQASRLAGQSHTYHFDRLGRTNQHLRHLLLNEAAHHASRLQALLLPQILVSTQRYSTSSPMDLFSTLVSNSSSTNPLPKYGSPLRASDTLTFAHLNPEMAKLTDLANRISHIIMLHWRIWDRIAYIPEEESRTPSPASAVAILPLSQTQSVPPPPVFDQESPVVATMKTGDTPEAGNETHVTHQTSSQQH